MEQIFKLTIACVLLFLTSCIKDDFPVRTIEGNIDLIKIEGQIGDPEIDKANYIVKVKVDDTVNIKNLQVSKLTVSNDAAIQIVGYPKFPSKGFSSLENIPEESNTVVNFENPVNVVLTTYQEYKWKIVVEQEIDREGGIDVVGQFGQPVVDEENHTIVIYVMEDVDLSKVEVRNMKIGGSAATVTPKAPVTMNFTRPQEFTVTSHGESTLWTVSVLHTEGSSAESDLSVWATKAYVNGSMQEGTTPVIEYKKKVDVDWMELPANAITTSGGAYKAIISGLQPATAYSYRVTIGSTVGEEIGFTTESAPIIENLGFENWSQGGKTWFPNLDASDSYWGTGNPGVTVIGKESNSTPSTDAIKGKAARLETVKVPLVGLAAGNIFTGGFKTNLSSPVNSVRFGRRFTGRPSKLKGYYKYKGGIIDVSDSDHKDQIGKPERFNIYISLEDWGPDVAKDKDGYEIRPDNRTVIGYGELVSSESVNDYREFTIDVDYKITDRKPTHVVIVATSSILGDYFTGYIGSTLYIDEFELVYD